MAMEEEVAEAGYVPSTLISCPQWVEATSLVFNADHVVNDAVIVVGRGREFRVNRLLLSAHSDVLQALFTFPNPAGQLIGRPAFRLVGVQGEASFEAILSWIYRHKLTLDPDNVVDILKDAHYLNCAEVMDICVNFLRGELGPADALGWQRFAQVYQIDALVEFCQVLVRQNWAEIAQEDEFLDLTGPELGQLLRANWRPGMAASDWLWSSVATWMLVDPSKRKHFLSDILPALPLDHRAESTFRHHIVPFVHRWVPGDPKIQDILDQIKRLFPQPAFGDY